MDSLITADALYIRDQIHRFWPGRFRVELEQPLNSLFTEPDNKGLKHIWKYGSADICVFRGDKLVAIFEPGGFQHIYNEKQDKNDRRKWKLCDINGVQCCHIMNGALAQGSNRKQRALLGKTIFGTKE